MVSADAPELLTVADNEPVAERYDRFTVTPRTSVLFGALVLVLLAFGGLADHALVEQRRMAEAAARSELGERARQAAQAVRSVLTDAESFWIRGNDPSPGFTVARRLNPKFLGAPRPSTPGYLRRSKGNLESLLNSTALTPSGLPVAVVAAVALGRPEAHARVADRLLTGLLPVDPDELPYLLETLGAENDDRAEALRARLRRVPEPAGLPLIPYYRRARTPRGLVQGVARDEAAIFLYEIPVRDLLVRAGVAGHAHADESPSVAGETVDVPGVAGLTLTVAPRVPDRLRLRGLRVLLWLAVLTSVVGLGGLLRGLRREERAVEREKAFLAGVTHELRTPLTAIRLFGERLAQGRGDAREYGAMVAEETQRLELLVERVLALPRGDEALSLSSLDPGELVRSVVGLAAARAERRHTVITTETPELPAVRWDSDAVRQALLNLLDNAIQHGREGGRVQVRADDADGFVRLSVSDDGPGIGKRDRRRIFGRFERGATSGPGTGLGLYLVDRVAKAHGGRVDLATEEGRGSTFSLVLPAEPPGTSRSSRDQEAPA